MRGGGGGGAIRRVPGAQHAFIGRHREAGKDAWVFDRAHVLPEASKTTENYRECQLLYRKGAGLLGRKVESL